MVTSCNQEVFTVLCKSAVALYASYLYHRRMLYRRIACNIQPVPSDPNVHYALYFVL